VFGVGDGVQAVIQLSNRARWSWWQWVCCDVRINMASSWRKEVGSYLQQFLWWEVQCMSH